MPYRVIRLTARNFKRITAVDLEFKNGSLIVSGRNDQGKSSTCDALIFALSGKDSFSDQPNVLRNNEEKGEVKIILEETERLSRLVVTRKWTKKNTRLIITDGEGNKQSSPQTILDNIIGRIAFDPEQFRRMKPAEQRDVLIDLLDIRTQLREFEKKRKEFYDDRHLANRRVKELDAILRDMERPSEDLPLEPVSNQEILDKMSDAQDVIRANAEKEKVLADAQRNFKYHQHELERLEKRKAEIVADLKAVRLQIETAHQSIVSAGKDVIDAEEACKALVEPNTLELKKELAEIAVTNEQIHAAQKYREREAEIERKGKEASELDEAIHKLDAAVLSLITNADLPIPGLGIENDHVTFEGVPLSQCGGAKQLRVSVAIAMALNPELKMIVVDESSGLDSQQLKVLIDFVESHNYQLLLTRIEYQGELPHIIINDGEVVDDEPGV